jgi:hypothetical protein
MKASFQTVCTLYKIFSTGSLFLNENNLMKIMIIKKRKGAKWHPFDHSVTTTGGSITSDKQSHHVRLYQDLFSHLLR